MKVLSQPPASIAIQGTRGLSTARLTSCVTRGEVVVGFSESPEYIAASAHKVYVAVMYFTMLHRDPDRAAYNYWVGVLDGGAPGAALLNGLLSSAEYHNRFLP
jgi:hypothetical protein